MTLVVDASVAVKWVLPEPDADKAVALRQREPVLIAPALVVAEIGNAIWKGVRRGDLTRAIAFDALRVAAAHFTSLVPLEELANRAMELAIDHRHPIYDCFYLALAERERAPLVSVDAKLLSAAQAIKRIEVRVL